jgi:hypothetical protein
VVETTREATVLEEDSAMQRHVGSAIASGILAGIVGAASMSVLAVVGAAVAGKGWYAPFELAGGLATGSTARFDAGLQPAAALAGVLLHFVIGAAWGAIFGFLVGYLMEDILPKEGVWLGASFGIVVWVVDLFTLMPRIDPSAARAIPLWFGALTHLGYGSVLGVLFHRFYARFETRMRKPAGPGLQNPSRPV